MWEDIALEMARVEREALARVRSKIASQQLGEAWVDLVHSHVDGGPAGAGQGPLPLDRLPAF